MAGFPSERRQHLRIEKHFIVTFYEADKTDADHSVSQLKNISRGGFCFSSSLALNPGTKIQAMIKTPYLGQSVSVLATVIDCKEKIHNVIYEVRVKIEETTPEVVDILKKIEQAFIKAQSQYQN